jgi:serine protease
MEDVYLRDHVGDTGDPHNGAVASSPDIIPRPDPVPSSSTPQATYGEGSGTENSETLGSTIEAGQDNFIYARVRNRGDDPVVDALAQVSVYWSEVATLVMPNLWHLIGQVGMDVPIGDVLTVTEKITWHQADIPAPGHYCFVATVGTPNDQVPPLTALADFNAFVQFVRDNNNVTWRNFNVVDNVQPFVIHPFKFAIAGAPKEEVEMGLEVIAHLPKKAKLLLEAPRDLLERFKGLELEVEGKRARVALHPDGRQDLGMAKFPAKLRAASRLLVELTDEAPPKRGGWSVAIRQYVTADRLEVGRVTWHFGKPASQTRSL